MDSNSQLQVRLVTDLPDLAVPTNTLSIPAKITPDGLTKLVHQLLKEEKDDEYEEQGWAAKNFQFVIFEEFLRGSLFDLLATKEQVSPETVFEIKYLESAASPEPGSSANHDDWVAGVSCKGDYVLTACYDNTVNIFKGLSGEKVLTIPCHSAPVRDVAWISLNDQVGIFSSCSHDQVVMLYKWSIANNSIETINACKGHERSVDCLAVSPDQKRLASGSFDSMLKIWGTSLQTSGTSGEPAKGEADKKKAKTDSKAITRTPIMTLGGHKEGVSGVAWIDNNEVATASWDHTIKLWDLELGGMKSELVANKSVFALSYSPLNHTILTASADQAIRLYDPRSTDGVLVKSQYTSHQGWVTDVDWSKEKEYLFASSGHDNLVKLWDSRSFKTPLYDLKGHEDRVLCCSWQEQSIIASGGADNTLKIFKSNS